MNRLDTAAGLCKTFTVVKKHNPGYISFFSRSPVRFAVAILLAVMALLVLSQLTSYQITRGMVELRKQELKRLVTLALNTIDPIRRDYNQGRLQRDEAMLRIRDRVRGLIYDDPETRNYLFMSSYRGIMLVQPFEPSKEGSDQWDLRDSYGTYIIRELTARARQGGGFVEYYYPPPDREIPELKISYVMGLDEFQCYLGTGLYIYDLEAVLTPTFRNTRLATLAVFALLSLLLFLFFKQYYIAYHLLQRQFQAVTRQPENLLKFCKNPFPENSEAGDLMNNFKEMLQELEQSRSLVKKSLEEKEILLQEVHHRVKNNLQIISSLLSLQTEYLGDPHHREIFSDSALRIHSMALIHETIYSSHTHDAINMQEYIKRLTASIMNSAIRPESPVRLAYELDDSSIDLNRAILCGLILTELITNALKHGLRDRMGAELRISYRDWTEKAEITVFDNGSGAPPDLLQRETESLGITLINSLTLQLEGTITYTPVQGSRFTLLFPL